MHTYIGIADCHGLESFISLVTFALDKLSGKSSSYTSQLQLLYLRAQANRHRHAVVYRVKLDSKDAKKVQLLIDNHNYKEALIKLKKFAVEVEVEKSLGMPKSWKLIPNDDLDPY